jgi:hypothetical protein
MAFSPDGRPAAATNGTMRDGMEHLSPQASPSETRLHAYRRPTWDRDEAVPRACARRPSRTYRRRKRHARRDPGGRPLILAAAGSGSSVAGGSENSDIPTMRRHG